MPRYYAKIRNVGSSRPPTLQINWLTAISNMELWPVKWISFGFHKTCGEFRVDRHETSVMLHSFSHKVKVPPGTRGVICIYPQKGDVWALYKNWSPDWNGLTAEEVIRKYDIVELWKLTI